MKYRYEVQLAALLHDIGKFYQKAGTKTLKIGGLQMLKDEYSHSEISAQFIERHRKLFESVGLDVDAIKEMVLRHHANNYGDKEKFTVQDASDEYISYCNIVNIGDNMSSSGDRSDKISKSAYRPSKSAYRPLASIFGTLGNKKINLRMSADSFLSYECASEEKRKEIDTNEDRKAAAVKMLEAFDNDVQKLYNIVDLDAETLIDKFNSILYKYTRFVNPATNTEYPDASLYDHSSTTCAIATCIHKNLHAKSGDNFVYKKFKDEPEDISMVKLELVGVNNYVSLNNMHRDELELTTGRFIVCQELVNNLSREILHKCKMSRANIIANSNTESYIMVAQCDLEDVEKIIKYHNKELFEMGKGLSLNWTVVKSWKFTKNDKAVSFHDNIKTGVVHNGILEMVMEDGKWNNSIFVNPSEKLKGAFKCKYCGSLTDKSNHVCESCGKELEIGTTVEDKKFSIIYALDPKFNETLLNGFNTYSMYQSSMSRISTYMRLMNEFFRDEVGRILENYDSAESLMYSMNSVYVVCKTNDVPHIALDIIKKYREYTSETMVVKVATSDFKSSTRNVDIIQYVNKRMIKLAESTAIVTVGGINGSDKTLEYYIQIVERVKKLNEFDKNSSVVYKLIDCLEMYIDYENTKDAYKLMCLPLMNNMVNKLEKNRPTGYESQGKLIKDVSTIIQNGLAECKSSKAKVWLEALNKSVRD